MCDRSTKKLLACFLLWAAALLLWEGAARSGVEGTFRLWPAAGFCLAAAALGAASCALPGRWRLVGATLFPLAYSYYGTQLVYAHVFGSYLTLAYAAMGGQAVTEFGGMVGAAVWACLPRLLLMAAPLVAFYLLRRRRMLPVGEGGYGREGLALLAAGVGGLAALVASLPLMGAGPGTPQAALVSASATIDRRAEQLGLLPAGALDAGQTLLGGRAQVSGGGLDLTAGGRGARNVLDGMDFEALAAETDDPDLRSLSQYFAGLQGTAKNSYTGLFQGYNLIVVCAEAFSPYLIDPELTPALYEMSTQGIIFENFYNSFPNLTTNGEYSLCTGLMPDLSRMSFALSEDNYLPFCLGHVFREQAGIVPLAFHNNIGTFYDRVNTHPNMGYDFRAIGCGLDMEEASPTSDLEMLEKTVDEYIGAEPFHAYYMTYSGHANYTFEENAVSAQNETLAAEIEGSEELRAYYACQLELERAMEYLLDRLEEAGLAERTVVVLTGDHSPYGLPEEDYETLAGEAAETDPFWQYRNCFLCWTGALDEPIVVEDYCCTQDILPTLLNLFGFDYDSRLLTGRDVLSDCTHAALLKDGSFLTDGFVYHADTGEVTWREGAEPDEDYAGELVGAMEEQFAVAAAILAADYYGWAFRTLGLSSGETEREEAASYADIEGTWYASAVEYLTSLGALSGGGTGDFLGEAPVTRAALTAMVSRGLGLEPGEERAPYSDLEEGLWYMEPVTAAWDAGLLPGEETFRPDEPAVEEEAAALLAAAGDYAGLEEAETLADEAVSAALTRQQAAGAELGEGVLSRGAAAWAVARLLRAVQPS